MSRKFVALLAITLAGAGVVALFAQPQKHEIKGPPQAQIKKMIVEKAERMSAPTEEHKRLAFLVGDFDQAVEVRAVSNEPLKSHVLATGEWILGERFVRVVCKSAPDEELKGERLLIYGYDTRAAKYTMWTIDTGSTYATSATGTFDPATKTFTFEGEMYGQGTDKVPFRWTLHQDDGGAFTHEILVKGAQGTEFVPVVVTKNTPRGK
jgi:hypothetical protein